MLYSYLVFISLLFLQSRIITPDGEILPYTDFKKTYPETCSVHGGVDCKEADVDGSVICRDGYRASPQKFVDECTEASLSILSHEGGRVSLKNDSPVLAKGVRVYYSRADLTKSHLAGPSEIDPFGLAQFEGRAKLPYEHLVVDCENCGPKSQK